MDTTIILLNTEKHISLDSSILTYTKIGQGINTQLCFHGFGQGKEVFESWIDQRSTIQLYSFDLFFHGKSQWLETKIRLEKSFLKALFTKFLEEENIQQFSILCFSIGARYAWALLELFPEKIQEIHLIAPDGIQENIWFKFASKTLIGNLTFKYLSYHQNILSKLVKLAHKLKLISKNQFRLAQSQVQNIAERKQVYHTWILLAKLKYHKILTNRILEKYPIQFFLYFSENDTVIPPKNLKKFLKNTPCQTFKLKKTHLKVLKEAKFLWQKAEKKHKIV